MRSLNNFQWLRKAMLPARRLWLRLSQGAEIAPTTSISFSSTFIGGPRGAIVIGDSTLVAFKSLLIARDPYGAVKPIRIGRHCFIGGGAVILPGVTISDESIVAAGAVVMDDVPPRCIVGGIPARILRENIEVGPFGRLRIADENQARYYIDPDRAKE